jgi:hypothetical protein
VRYPRRVALSLALAVLLVGGVRLAASDGERAPASADAGARQIAPGKGGASTAAEGGRPGRNRGAGAASGAALARSSGGDAWDRPADGWGGNEAESGEEARRGEGVPDPAAPRALFLLAAARERDGLLLTARGFDLRAPRALTLWQVDPGSGRAAPVAMGESASDGRFRFERLLLPTHGTRLVAAPRGVAPDGAAASFPVEVARLAPAPPRAAVEDAGETWIVRARVAEGAALWLRDPAGGEPFRVGPPAGEASARDLRAALPPPPGGRLEVAQSLDGRRSAWRAVAPRALDDPHSEEDSP